MNGRRFALCAWLLAGTLGAATVLAYGAGLRLNTTPSMPVGVWRIEAQAGTLERGQVVSICPVDSPAFQLARRRGYVPRGHCPGDYEPLFKPVAAVAGDIVMVTTAGLAVNGQIIPNSQVMARDELGELPAVPPGSYAVAADTVWVVSRFNPASFDSRYFGPLPVSQVEGIVRPVWVRERR